MRVGIICPKHGYKKNSYCEECGKNTNNTYIGIKATDYSNYSTVLGTKIKNIHDLNYIVKEKGLSEVGNERI